MTDPFAVIFVPGGTAAAIVLFAGPLLLLRHYLWKREARRRNEALQCARCQSRLAIDDLYLYHGAHVCGGCASTLRRRFQFAIPVALAVATGFGISSLTAFSHLVGSGRTELGWWLDGRWIPLLLPSVGVATAIWLFLRLGHRANRQRDAEPWLALEGRDVRDWDLFRRRVTTLAGDEGSRSTSVDTSL